MKKLTGFAAIVLLLLGAWSGTGWYLLRGAGAYRLHTTLGNVFAVSWQYTALAAVLLAVILLAVLIRRIRRKKNAPLQAVAGETAATPAPEQETAPKKGLKFGKKKDKKAADAPAEGKIDPAAAETELMESDETVLMDAEEKIAPAQGTVLMDAEEKIAPAQGTVLMDAEEKIAPAQGTVLMDAEEKIPPAGPVAGRCAVCGAKLKEGARFCGECGAKVIGGGV